MTKASVVFMRRQSRQKCTTRCNYSRNMKTFHFRTNMLVLVLITLSNLTMTLNTDLKVFCYIFMVE